MKLVGGPIHQAEEDHRGSSEEWMPLPPWWGQGKKKGKAQHRIGQAMQELVDIDNIRQGKTTAGLMRQIENAPHDQGHREESIPVFSPIH